MYRFLIATPPPPDRPGYRRVPMEDAPPGFTRRGEGAHQRAMGGGGMRDRRRGGGRFTWQLAKRAVGGLITLTVLGTWVLFLYSPSQGSSKPFGSSLVTVPKPPSPSPTPPPHHEPPAHPLPLPGKPPPLHTPRKPAPPIASEAGPQPLAGPLVALAPPALEPPKSKPIRRLVVLGERASGAECLRDSLVTLFRLTVAWELGVEPFDFGLGQDLAAGTEDVLFVGIVREPVAWLMGMRNDPASLEDYGGKAAFKRLTWADFLFRPWDYGGPTVFTARPVRRTRILTALRND
jgi:hypothetical protein